MPDQPQAPAKAETPDIVGGQETPGAAPVQDIADVYGDFDAADKTEPTPSAPAPPKPASKAQPKPATPAAKPAPEPDKTPAKPEPAAKPDFKSLSDEEYAKLDKPARVAYNASLRQRNATLESELHKLRTEGPKAKPADDTRIKELQAQIEERDNRLKELDSHLRTVAYEKSQEFQDKYQKPYVAAYVTGRKKAAQLRVAEIKNDVDEVVQQARQGTEEDFDAIMRIADDNLASEKAVELFGTKASVILYYRERVNELQEASRAALEDHRGRAATLDKERAEKEQRQAQETEEANNKRAELFRSSVDKGAAEHPDWFKVEEGDEEGKTVVESGKAMANALLTGVNPRTGKPFTPEGLVRYHAFVHNVISAHGPLLHQLKAAKSKIGDLEAQLAEFKESGTLDDAGRTGESGASSGLAGDEEFYEADRVRR